MCGIFGQYHLPGADPALIERMARRLAHRGPDGYGVFCSEKLAFGAGRLAIIDLSAPAGPIFNEDRSIAVVFNGEIYNHRVLRAELEAQGHRFVTKTDTEVIVHGYEAWGAAVIERLRGMFALGIWDSAAESLWLARDRLGEKPLYYAPSDEYGFLFASEIKALFEHPGLRRAVNHEALSYYLAMGHLPPPLTMFAGIFKLAPGEMLRIDHQGVEKRCYWQPSLEKKAPGSSYHDAVQQVRAAVIDAVESRMMSDVPVGAFLSGGVDSTAVVAIMQRAVDRPLKTFTVGFDFHGDAAADEKFNVDVRYAALAAEKIGTDHTMIQIQPEILPHLLPQLIYHLDEPVMQPAIIQTAHVAALARSQGVPVLLSGDAGDELFLGYHRYRFDRLLSRYLSIPALLRKTLLTPLLEKMPQQNARKLAAKSRRDDPLERYLEWMQVFPLKSIPAVMAQKNGFQPADSLSLLAAALGSFPGRHFAETMALANLRLWLAEDSNMRVDKMSMAASIESRAPLEDHLLAELALSLPLEYKLRGGDFKAVFKDAVREWIPQEILQRPKWGFMPPASDWLRTHLLPLVRAYLAPDYVQEVGIFDAAAVSELVEGHLSKRRYDLWGTWALLVFHLWHAMMIDQRLSIPAPFDPAALVSHMRL